MPTSLRTLLQRLEVDPFELRLLDHVSRGEPVHHDLRTGDADRAVTEIRRVIELTAPPGAVWQRLWDIHALAGCIPGCGDVEAIEEHRRYRATIRDQVGPFRIAIPLEILRRGLAS